MKRLLSTFITVALIASTFQLYGMDFESEMSIKEEKGCKALSPYVFNQIKPFANNSCFIVLNDNSVKRVPLEQIKSFKTLSNAIKFNKSPVIDLHLYSELTSQKELLLLLDCAGPHSKKTVDSLSKDVAKKMLVLADILQAKDSVLQQLSEKVLPTLEQENFKNLFHSMQRSIKNILLAKKHDYPVKLPKQKNSSSLLLNEIKLDSLDGIEQLKSKSIKILDISHNNLKKLQLKKIVNAFPNIAIINANHNKINSLSKEDLEAIFEGLILHLEHNQIDTIEVGDGINAYNAHINLNNNPLSSTALENLYDTVKPSKRAQLKNNLKNNLKKLLVYLKNNSTLVNSILYNTCMIALTGNPHMLNLPEIVRLVLCILTNDRLNEIYSLDPIFLIDKAYRLLNNATGTTANNTLFITAVINIALYSQLYIPQYLDQDKIMKIIDQFEETPKKILHLISPNNDCKPLIAKILPNIILSAKRLAYVDRYDFEIFRFDYYNVKEITLDFIKTAILINLPDEYSLSTNIFFNNSSFTKECAAAFKKLKSPSFNWKNPTSLMWKYVFFCREKLPKIPYPYNLLIGALGVTLKIITNYAPLPTIHETTHPSKIIVVDKNISYIGLKKKEGAYDQKPPSMEDLD